MADPVVTSAEFQRNAGKFIEMSGKTPVTITKHKRPVRVLLDIEEYERLQAYDQRQTSYAHEMTPDIREALDAARMAPEHDHLNDLMDD